MLMFPLPAPDSSASEVAADIYIQVFVRTDILFLLGKHLGMGSLASMVIVPLTL